MHRLTFVLLGLALAFSANAEYVDHVFVPPATVKAALDMPQPETAALLEMGYPVTTFDTFAGQTKALRTAAEKQLPMRVAEGFVTELEAGALVGDAFMKDGFTTVLGAVQSVDAQAIRLLVDLIGLDTDDELWVIDPTGPRAFGPFTGDDAEADGTWLPTIQGDTAVLMLRSTDGETPPVRIEMVSHFFAELETLKYDVCPIPIACETDTTVQEVSTGIGRVILPAAAGGQFLCTGALINNATTAELEPLFIFANHCVDGIDVVASGIEVYWDYRSWECRSNSSSTSPALWEVPRNTGAVILAENSTVDGELIELQDEVPVGEYGRAWLGWDTRTPLVNDLLMGIHHPQGTDMKLASGHVTAVDTAYTASRRYEHVTRVIWDEGVTEGGSSGSPLLFRDHNCRILGMLSGGAVHRCSTPESNYDFYASFRHFFDTYGGFLTTGPTVAQMAWVLTYNWDDIDADLSGGLSFAESTDAISSMSGTLFTALDLNDDGEVTYAEATSYLPKGTGCHAAETPTEHSSSLLLLLAMAGLLGWAARRRTNAGRQAR